MQKPLSNLWLGVSVENQRTADERIPILLQIPAIHYFISHGPALGSIIYPKEFLSLGKSTVLITEGESGPNARPMHPDIPRRDRDQCQRKGINFFFKQWGEWAGSESSEMKQYKKFEQFKLHRFEDGTCMYRIGKKRTGHLLDGKEWREFPDSMK